MYNAFEALGIDENASERDVKRAYAARVKTIDVEQDPAAFQQLRGAYEHALWLARNPQVMAAMQADEDFAAAESNSAIEAPAEAPTTHEEHETISAPVLAPARGWSALDTTAKADDEHASVHDLVERLHVELAALTEHGAAHAAVRTTRELPALQSFSAREDFEVALAEKMCRDTNLHPAVLLGVAAAMQWREDMHLLASLRNDLAYQLQRRIHGASLISEWETLRAQGNSAARILMGKYQPRYFRFSLIPDDCLQHLRQLVSASWGADFEGLRGAPDPRVLAWWNENQYAPRLSLSNLLLSIGAMGAVFVWLATLRESPIHSMGDVKIWVIGALSLLAGVATLGGLIGGQLGYGVLQQRYLFRLERNPVFAEGWVVITPIIIGLCALGHKAIPAWLLSIVAVVTTAWLLFANRIRVALEMLFFGLLFTIFFWFWIRTSFAMDSLILPAALSILMFVFITYLPWRVAQIVEQWSVVPRNVYRFAWLGVGLALIAGASVAPSETPDVSALLGVALFVMTVLGLANITYRPGAMFAIYVAGTLFLPFMLKSFLESAPLLAAKGMNNIVCLFVIVALHFAVQSVKDDSSDNGL